MPDGSATAHLYFPKLATVLTEGYGFGPFRKDILAGLTVAIVALPLSMAIAVASGVAPEIPAYPQSMPSVAVPESAHGPLLPRQAATSAPAFGGKADTPL